MGAMSMTQTTKPTDSLERRSVWRSEAEKRSRVLPVMKITGIICLLISCAPPVGVAAVLKPETLEAWEAHVRNANSHFGERLKRAKGEFLFIDDFIDDAPDRRHKLILGETPVWPAGEHNPKKVPSGLIHDWMGEIFIPDCKIEDVLAVVRDYGRYKDFFAPLVIESRPLSQADTIDRYSILMRNKALFSQIALDSDYEESYVRLNETQWYSVGYSTRIQEIADYGRPSEHKLRPDEGSGFIWRLYSLQRFEEREGGVCVQLEVIALSRDIPAALRWLVDPIVRRISKGSLLTSLQKTREAVRAAVETGRHAP
jgi:hypothetical protein